MSILVEFQSMWEGQTGPMDIAKSPIHLTLENTEMTHSASYRAEPKTRESVKAAIEKIPSQNVIEPARVEWAAPREISSGKDYPYACAFTTENRTPTLSVTHTRYLSWTSVLTPSEKFQLILLWMQTVATGKSKWKKPAATERHCRSFVDGNAPWEFLSA